MSLSDFQLSYEISPIILVGGIAGTGMLPLVSILSSQNYEAGVTSSSSAQTNEDYFGHFRVLPGHTLMDNDVAMYPLANQSVAANAVITNPLRLAVEMLIPANDQVTLSQKLSIVTNLKSKLDDHTAQGGWYNVATPSYIYQGCLLTSLTEASDDEEGTQPQVRWVWNFLQPLITLAAAQAAQNQAMAKISNQTQNSGDPPGSATVSTGISQPSSNIVQNVVPAASGPGGSNVAPTSGIPGGVPNAQSVSPITPGGA